MHLVFPEEYYVTMKKIDFATPDGTNAAAKKRKATADGWAKGYRQPENPIVMPIRTLNITAYDRNLI